MKKVLLGTSAIALAGAFAAPADAAEWTVRVGGYMEQFTGYASTDTESGNVFASDPDFDGIDSKSDTEIHFLPSITLDNGMQFGGVVELEGNSTGDQIDESYMRIKGSFGEINLGSENSAGYKMTYAAPNVTFIGTNSGSLTAFFPISGPGTGADVFRGTLGASFVEVGRNNDAQRFTYYTPRFAGLQAGVSYARDGNQDSNAQVDTDQELHDIFDVGVNYVNSFGAFNVAVSGRYGRGDLPGGGDPEVWAAGLNLGYGGFTIGGSYADADGDHGPQEGEYWDVGVSYETGPWGFSFTHARGENKNNEEFGLVSDGMGGTQPGLNNDEELHQYMLGVNYTMAQGVNLNVFGAYVDFEEDEETFVANGEEEEFDGWVIGTGVKINF